MIFIFKLQGQWITETFVVLFKSQQAMNEALNLYLGDTKEPEIAFMTITICIAL